MGHHKRGRSRARRAGCKLCKPWKLNSAASAKHERWKERRDRDDAREQISEGESARRSARL